MFAIVSALPRYLLSCLRPKHELALENLALRHQIALLKRSAHKPRVRGKDRLFWVVLKGWRSNWPTIQTVGGGPVKPRKRGRFSEAGWLGPSFCRWPPFFACGLYLILYKRCRCEQRSCQSAPAAMACLRRLGPYATPTPTRGPHGPRLLLPAATQVRQTQLPLCQREI